MDKIEKLLQLDKYSVEIELCQNGITFNGIKTLGELLDKGVKFNQKEKGICLSIDTLAEITDENIEKFNIKSLVIGFKENTSQEEISISKYKRIREILNEVIKDIEPELDDKAKFKIIYTRLANMLTYDYEAIKEDSKYATENKKKCRNLENGVLLGKCVCVGYAEILKQTLSLVGIECHNIGSKSDEENIGHEYSIVKIDGKWYNADLTWDYEKIRNGEKPKYCLKNDKDFIESALEENRVYHIPEHEIEWKCMEESIDIYPEFSKNKTSQKILNYIEKSLKKVWNAGYNIGKNIRAQFIKETLLLPEVNTIKTDKKNEFKEDMKKGAPSMDKQLEFAKKFNSKVKNSENVIKNEEEKY